MQGQGCRPGHHSLEFSHRHSLRRHCFIIGGPNYVSQFMEFEETAEPPIGAIRGESYLLWLAGEWKVELLWGKHGQ